MFTLVEELFLLSLREKRNNISTSSTLALPYALAGAMVAELILAGKVSLKEDKHIVVVDPAGFANTPVRRMLESMISAGKPKKLSYWIDQYGSHGKRMRDDLLDDLTKKGVLRDHEKRYFWVIPYKEYTDLNASAKFAIKEKLRRIVFCKEEADTHSVVLLSLLRAASMLENIFTEDEIKASIKQVGIIVENEAVGQAVIDLMSDIADAAIAAAIASAYA